LYRDLGDTDKALATCQDVVTERKKQLAANPKSFAALGSLALSVNNLGVLQLGVGKPADAQKSFQEALDLRLEQVKRDPKNSLAKVALAASYRDLGAAQMAQGKSDAGLKAWEKALQLREQMAKEHHTIGYYQADLAG